MILGLIIAALFITFALASWWTYHRAFIRAIEPPARPLLPESDPANRIRASLVTFAGIQQIIKETAVPYVPPYDYWREKWIRTGNPEALSQMTRFVDDDVR